MKKFLLSVLAVFFALQVFSQEERPSYPTYKNEFGIHAGFSTGVGLSYRHWLKKNGFQLTFIPVKSDETVFLSGGLTFLHSFHQSKYVTVFGYIGNHVYYSHDKYAYETWNDQTQSYDYETVNESETHYNIGFGPGFAFGKTVVFNIMAGYGLYDVTGSFNMLPTVEMGVYYRF